MNIDKFGQQLLNIVKRINQRRGLTKQTLNAIVSQKDRAQLVECAQSAAKHGYMASYLGEMSRRVEGGKFVITAGDSWFQEITDRDLLVCSTAGDWISDTARAPNKINWHRRLYQATIGNAALLSQPPYATMLAFQGRAPLPQVLIETTRFVGDLQVVDTISTKDFEGKDMAKGAWLIRGIGLFVCGQNLSQVLSLTDMIERWCQISTLNRD